MRKIFVLLALCCLFEVVAVAQITTTDQKVKHNHYTTYYNPVKRAPDSVVWDLTPAMINCASLSGTRHFKQDPDIQGSPGKDDYSGVWSRGHLFNFKEAQCSETDITESCYMSNMEPQDQHFNAGDWKTVETYEQGLARHGATLHILAGGIGSQGRNSGGVTIPQKMWKAIYTNGTWTYWIMDNVSTSVGHNVNKWKTDKVTFDRETGLIF